MFIISHSTKISLTPIVTMVISGNKKLMLIVFFSSRHFARVGSGERGEQVEVEQRQENNHPLDYRFQKDTNEVKWNKLCKKDLKF